MKLNQISNNPGAHKRKDKLGRGSSSGLGKTSGRGVKGAKARTGNQVHGFEGGQMPLHMRMPKRGFRNIFGTDFAEVNLNRIRRRSTTEVEGRRKITEDVLRKAGLGTEPGWRAPAGQGRDHRQDRDQRLAPRLPP
jgi:large subunit ribosomal protein L15